MRNAEALAKTMQMENVRTAGNTLGRLFVEFASKISEAERNDFFHPMNRSSWQGEFARWLEERKGTND